MTSPVDYIQRKLAERAERRAIAARLDETNRQLARIADAFEIFSKPAEMELLDKVEKSVRRGQPGQKFSIDEFDPAAAEAEYERTQAELGTPPPPDNTQTTGPI